MLIVCPKQLITSDEITARRNKALSNTNSGFHSNVLRYIKKGVEKIQIYDRLNRTPKFS